MHNLLSKLFQKKGINDITELSSEEREDFDRWQKILVEEEITVNSITEFCKYQTSKIEQQFGDVNNNAQKIEKLVLLHSVYKGISNLTEGSKSQKEALIKYLTNLI